MECDPDRRGLKISLRYEYHSLTSDLQSYTTSASQEFSKLGHLISKKRGLSHTRPETPNRS